jgi:hypothetical protein
MIKTFTINPKTKDVANRDLLPYDLIRANIAHDSWSYGVVLFELFTGKKLLFADCDDNVDNLDLLEVYNFSQVFRQRKLQTIR